PVMTTRTSKGNSIITLGKKEKRVREVLTNFTERYGDAKGYRKYKIPATGVLLNEKNIDVMQISINDTL
ncbi:MAG: hypothetical protein J6U87_02885, partial [Clostridia bacterium]|nr:hypothetical protein [Clostridia bacterium]